MVTKSKTKTKTNVARNIKVIDKNVNKKNGDRLIVKSILVKISILTKALPLIKIQ